MIVCVRTVQVPEQVRSGYLEWIQANRKLREEHGILLELVLEPSAGEGDTIVITAWPSHEQFDAWIATPDRDRLTASEVHRSVDYQPIARYDVAGGYINVQAPALEEQR